MFKKKKNKRIYRISGKKKNGLNHITHEIITKEYYWIEYKNTGFLSLFSLWNTYNLPSFDTIEEANAAVEKIKEMDSIGEEDYVYYR